MIRDENTKKSAFRLFHPSVNGGQEKAGNIGFLFLESRDFPWGKAGPPGILVGGAGYPDIVTDLMNARNAPHGRDDIAFRLEIIGDCAPKHRKLSGIHLPRKIRLKA